MHMYIMYIYMYIYLGHPWPAPRNRACWNAVKPPPWQNNLKNVFVAVGEQLQVARKILRPRGAFGPMFLFNLCGRGGCIQ